MAISTKYIQIQRTLRAISFDLNRFLYKNRLTLPEMALKANIPYATLHRYASTQSVPTKRLRKLEETFGDLSEYLTPPIN